MNDLIKIADGRFCVRMDDDDIMSPERMKECFKLHCEQKYDLVSSNIDEFSKDVSSLTGRRVCSENLKSLKSFIRNPINHVATSFSKDAIVELGGYRPVKSFEDWNLWLRCMNLRYKKCDKTLVYVRANNNMVSRRTGYSYIKSEIAFY